MQLKKLGVTFISFAAISLILAGIISSPSYAFNRGIQDGVEAARGVDQPGSLFGATGVFTTITNVLLFIIGAISVIMIIIGGLRYVISGGDSSNVTAAKNTILYAIVGVVVALLAYAIVNFVIGGFTPGGGFGSEGTDV
ncbi:MAG TPA: hypothetical protein VFM68_00980 [Candidatus Saccharimonadales bacterium]|nr:hypothetical protein [Candidatus Saccharimonadales bacterium]